MEWYGGGTGVSRSHPILDNPLNSSKFSIFSMTHLQYLSNDTGGGRSRSTEPLAPKRDDSLWQSDLKSEKKRKRVRFMLKKPHRPIDMDKLRNNQGHTRANTSTKSLLRQTNSSVKPRETSSKPPLIPKKWSLDGIFGRKNISNYDDVKHVATEQIATGRQDPINPANDKRPGIKIAVFDGASADERKVAVTLLETDKTVNVQGGNIEPFLAVVLREALRTNQNIHIENGNVDENPSRGSSTIQINESISFVRRNRSYTQQKLQETGQQHVHNVGTISSHTPIKQHATLNKGRAGSDKGNLQGEASSIVKKMKALSNTVQIEPQLEGNHSLPSVASSSGNSSGVTGPMVAQSEWPSHHHPKQENSSSILEACQAFFEQIGRTIAITLTENEEERTSITPAATTPDQHERASKAIGTGDEIESYYRDAKFAHVALETAPEIGQTLSKIEEESPSNNDDDCMVAIKGRELLPNESTIENSIEYPSDNNSVKRREAEYRKRELLRKLLAGADPILDYHCVTGIKERVVEIYSHNRQTTDIEGDENRTMDGSETSLLYLADQILAKSKENENCSYEYAENEDDFSRLTFGSGWTEKLEALEESIDARVSYASNFNVSEDCAEDDLSNWDDTTIETSPLDKIMSWAKGGLGWGSGHVEKHANGNSTRNTSFVPYERLTRERSHLTSETALSDADTLYTEDTGFRPQKQPSPLMDAFVFYLEDTIQTFENKNLSFDASAFSGEDIGFNRTSAFPTAGR